MSMINFLIHTASFSNNPVKFAQDYHKKAGSPFLLQMTPKHGVWVSGTTQAAKTLFSAKPDSFTSFEPSDPLKILTGPHSLILANGNEHLCEKQAMAPVFHGDNLHRHLEIMRLHTLSDMQNWREGMPIDLTYTMKSITLNIILTVIFGVDDPGQLSLFRDKTFTLLKHYTPSLMFIPMLRQRYWNPWRNFLKARGAFDDLLLTKINDARQSVQTDKHDILSKLANLTLSNGKQWTEAQLLDQLRTLLIAGHETSATALAWALFYILSNPDIEYKLRTELESSSVNYCLENIIKLPYLTAVCQEALRIHPVVPIIIRTLNKPFEFEGKLLNPGENIGLSITLLHSDKQFWQNPEQFNPERFIENKFTNYQYIPFGGGSKRCLGASFALFEMKIILATILLNSTMSITASKIMPPKLYGLTMGPRRPISATIKSCSP